MVAYNKWLLTTSDCLRQVTAYDKGLLITSDCLRQMATYDKGLLKTSGYLRKDPHSVIWLLKVIIDCLRKVNASEK